MVYSWWINPYLYDAMSADGGDPKIDKEDGSISIKIVEGIGYNKNRPWAMDGAFQLYLGRPTTRACDRACLYPKRILMRLEGCVSLAQ